MMRSGSSPSFPPRNGSPGGRRRRRHAAATAETVTTTATAFSTLSSDNTHALVVVGVEVTVGGKRLLSELFFLPPLLLCYTGVCVCVCV